MKFIIKFITFAMMLLTLSSCADKKEPPLPGTRLNVLHYDLLKEEAPVKVNIILPPQAPLFSWMTSDTGQFTGMPTNISLAKNLKRVQKFSPNKFNPSSQDSAWSPGQSVRAR